MSKLQKFVFGILMEALSPIPDDKGQEELHEFPGGHKVYVKIAHHGNGNHKVTALYIPPGKERGTVARKDIQSVPSSIRQAAVMRTFGTVKNFMASNQWNSIVLGGSDAKNKALYRRVGDSIAGGSGGKIESRHIPGAGVQMRKSEPIVYKATPTPTPPREDLAPYRKQAGSSGSGSKSRSSDRSSEGSSGPKSQSKPEPFGSKGVFGPKGPWKIGDTLESKKSAKRSKSEMDKGASADSAGSSAESGGSSA